MKKGKYVNVRSAKRAGRKMAALVLALILCVGGVVGGTLAWLTDTSDEVKNTFTTSDINITLTETFNTDTNQDQENDAWFGKMVPGNTIAKDPKVTVLADSEACWLFVKVVESENYEDYLTHEIATGWTPLPNVNGVYYRTVDASTADQEFAVLKDNVVTVSTDVTKQMMDDIEEGTAANPTLTFTAYAIQQASVDTAAAAWSEISGTSNAPDDVPEATYYE